MHQIKIFKGLESELSALEKQINEWLAQGNPRVINIFGNISPQSVPVEDKNTALGKGAFAPSDVLLIVHYELA